MNRPYRSRVAGEADMMAVLAWRNQPRVRAAMLTKDVILEPRTALGGLANPSIRRIASLFSRRAGYLWPSRHSLIFEKATALAGGST